MDVSFFSVKISISDNCYQQLFPNSLIKKKSQLGYHDIPLHMSWFFCVLKLEHSDIILFFWSAIHCLTLLLIAMYQFLEYSTFIK